jgi:hypothetical protein
MAQTSESSVAVELCLRSSAPSVARGRQDEVRDCVEALDGEGQVAETTVSWWSSRVCTPGSDAGPADRCPRVVGEILAVGERDGVAIEPYFRRRAAARDGDEDVIFLPVICLLVRRDGELQGLYPATVDGERYTVEDGLDRLAAGEDATNLL